MLLGKIGPGMEASLVAKEILTYLISHGDFFFKCGSILIPRYIGEKKIYICGVKVSMCLRLSNWVLVCLFFVANIPGILVCLLG